MSSEKVITGVLAGVAAGVLIGILLAPEKGSVTRKKITKEADDFAQDLIGRFNEFVDTLNQKFDDLKDEMGSGNAKVNDDIK